MNIKDIKLGDMVYYIIPNGLEIVHTGKGMITGIAYKDRTLSSVKVTVDSVENVSQECIFSTKDELVQYVTDVINNQLKE